MASGRDPEDVRVISGEIKSGAVTTRLAIPSSGRTEWPPFSRVSESLASQKRQLPAHVHDHEEVLTYVLEGVAAYELEGRTAELLPPGSARLLTAPARAVHRVGPRDGASIRWFNIVLALPDASDRSARLQAVDGAAATRWVDEVEVQPLSGPRGPMMPASSLECEAMAFPKDSTTFRKVGRDRRALLYAWAGQGWVNELAITSGQTALVDGTPGVGIRGGGGFRAIFAAAPKDSQPPSATK